MAHVGMSGSVGTLIMENQIEKQMDNDMEPRSF